MYCHRLKSATPGTLEVTATGNSQHVQVQVPRYGLDFRYGLQVCVSTLKPNKRPPQSSRDTPGIIRVGWSSRVEYVEFRLIQIHLMFPLP